MIVKYKNKLKIKITRLNHIFFRKYYIGLVLRAADLQCSCDLLYKRAHWVPTPRMV